MKRIYSKPTFESKIYAHLENVFTYCDRNQSGCSNVTGSGNDSDKPDDMNPNETTSHAGIPHGTTEDPTFVGDESDFA